MVSIRSVGPGERETRAGGLNNRQTAAVWRASLNGAMHCHADASLQGAATQLTVLTKTTEQEQGHHLHLLSRGGR